jgi:hypothetical protein
MDTGMIPPSAAIYESRLDCLSGHSGVGQIQVFRSGLGFDLLILAAHFQAVL